MELHLTDDQEFFRETTQRFLAEQCPMSTVRTLGDTETGMPEGYWAQAAELGWASLLVPESLGGGCMTGTGVIDLSIVADAVGAAVGPGPLIPVNVVADALARSGSDAQHELLPGIVAGETITAWVGAEHAVGDDGPTAARDGDDIVLSGTSTPVEAAAQAGQLLVTASGDGGLLQLLVPADTTGITITPLHTVDLARRFARVDLDGVRVPADAVVGTDAAADVERQLQLATMLEVAQMAGAAQVIFDTTLEWTFDRYSFGRPLASYQEIKHRMADLKLWLETCHGLVTAVARAVEHESDDAWLLASSAASYCGEYLTELAHDTIQIHGGIGLTTELDLHLSVRRITVGRAMYGTPAQHRARIGRAKLAEVAENGAAA